MRLPSGFGSSGQTKHYVRSVWNTSCPVQPSVQHRYEVLTSRVTVIVVELDEQVVKLVAIIY